MTVSRGGVLWSKIHANKRRVSVGGAFVVWKKGENRELLTGLDTRKIFLAIPLVRVYRHRGA